MRSVFCSALLKRKVRVRKIMSWFCLHFIRDMYGVRMKRMRNEVVGKPQQISKASGWMTG